MNIPDDDDANTLDRIAIVNADKCKPKVPKPCMTQFNASRNVVRSARSRVISGTKSITNGYRPGRTYREALY